MKVYWLIPTFVVDGFQSLGLFKTKVVLKSYFLIDAIRL